MKTRIPWIVVAVLAAVSVFLGIKLQEKPREVIKEVPVDRVVEKRVEVIKEVPKEVIKEVPVEVIKEVRVDVVKEVEKPIPPEYVASRELGLKFQNARFAPREEKLKGVKSVYLTVTLPDEMKAGVSADNVKSKIEQELKTLGIVVADKPSATDAWLSYTIEVVKRDDNQSLAYVTSFNLLGSVYVFRAGEIFKTTSLVWTSGTLGSVGINDAKHIGEAYEADLAAFANAHRKANPRQGI